MKRQRDMKQYVELMYQVRERLKAHYKDNYTRWIDSYIELVRKVMREKSVPAGPAAELAFQYGDDKQDFHRWWLYAAAMEIELENQRKVELN